MLKSTQAFTAADPATGETVWQGAAANSADIDLAVAQARTAFDDWAATSLQQRIEYLQAFGQQVQTRRADFIEAICKSTGKPRWESATEVDAVFGKIALTIQAYNERKSPKESQSAETTSATRYKPHGVLAVFGPFNFPAHLPNGHILPALLAGNTVIFKPSEQTPLVGEIYSQLWKDAGLPALRLRGPAGWS